MLLRNFLCGFGSRRSDTFPGLTDDEKELARENMRENGRPLFAYSSDGLSEPHTRVLVYDRARRDQNFSTDMSEGAEHHPTNSAKKVVEGAS